MHPEELQRLLARAESDVLEFKARLPNIDLIARLISAFANTKGGTLVIGVKEGKEDNEIIGIDHPERAQRFLEQAKARVSPSIVIHSEVVTLNDKSILVVTIPKGQHSPYLVGGQALQRIDDRIVPMVVSAPDVHSSAYRAITSGSVAITQGGGAVAAGAEGVAIGRDVSSGLIITQLDIIPYDAAFERLVGSTAFVLNQLELSYRQTRKQAQGWFRFSQIAAVVGFVLIGIGVIAVIFGQTTVGAITAVSSLVPEGAAALFFVQSKAENKRVDAIQKRLTDAREVQTAVEIVNTIGDPSARDKLKAEIVRKTLRIKPPPTKQ